MMREKLRKFLEYDELLIRRPQASALSPKIGSSIDSVVNFKMCLFTVFDVLTENYMVLLSFLAENKIKIISLFHKE